MRVATGEQCWLKPDAGAVRRANFCTRGLAFHAAHAQAEADLVGGGMAWVQRGVAVLEHHLHLPPQLTHRHARRSPTGSPSSTMLARIRLDQAHQQPTGGRLAAAGFTDDAQGFPLHHAGS